MNKINAIIMAGTSKKKRKLIDEDDGRGPKNKALVTVHKEPVILNVLQALKNSKYINSNNIVVIGPRPELRDIIKDSEALILPEEKRFIDNARKAYGKISPNGERTFITSCDLPYINAEAIEDFVMECEKYYADFYFSLINAKNIPKKLERLNKSMKFYLEQEGYKTSNMSIFEGRKVKNRKKLEYEIEKVFSLRRTISIPAFKRLYGTFKHYKEEFKKHRNRNLTEQDVTTAIKREVGIELKLIITKNPKSAIDIDYKRDYKYIKKNYWKIKEILDNFIPSQD